MRKLPEYFYFVLLKLGLLASHSQNMTSSRYMEHCGPKGVLLTEREAVILKPMKNKKVNSLTIIDRPGVARAVLQTASSLTD